jgi:hypothetical protein
MTNKADILRFSRSLSRHRYRRLPRPFVAVELAVVLGFDLRGTFVVAIVLKP